MKKALTIFVAVLTIAITITGSVASPAHAILNRDKKHVIEDTPWYDPTDELCAQVGAGTGDAPTNVEASADQKQREKVAFDYFVRKFIAEGASPGQAEVWAAGIVGNLAGESGVNPAADNPAATRGGGGIAQWEGGRWDGPQGLLKFAAARGKPWTDFGTQLDFLWWELHNSEKRALDATKGATSVSQAAVIFMLTFERPSIPHTARRIEHANRIYAANKGQTPQVTNPNAPVNNETTSRCNANDAVAGDSGACAAGSEDQGMADGYKGGQKTQIRICKITGTSGIIINSSISAPMVKMIADAKAAGVELSGSGFRTMESQIALRKENGCPADNNAPSSACRIPTARPGYSNHQMGLAIDFRDIGQNRGSRNYRWIDSYMKGAGAGFLKNFPLEAWHWSVDGK